MREVVEPLVAEDLAAALGQAQRRDRIRDRIADLGEALQVVVLRDQVDELGPARGEHGDENRHEDPERGRVLRSGQAGHVDAHQRPRRMDQVDEGLDDLLQRRLTATGSALQLSAQAQIKRLLATQSGKASDSDVSGSVAQIEDLPADLGTRIWSSRAETSLDDLVMELENLARRQGIPVKPFAGRLRAWRERAKAELLGHMENHLLRSLARPGGPLQRGLYHFTGWLSWLLPMAAAVWASYHLVVGYYLGIEGKAGFLGLNFAIHTGLLIGIAWLLPWLLRGRLKPSLPGAVGKAMQQGIASGIAGMRQQGGAVLQQIGEELAQQRSALSIVQTGLQQDLSLQPAESASTRAAPR